MVDYNGVIFERSTLQSDRLATGDGFDPPKVETHFLAVLRWLAGRKPKGRGVWCSIWEVEGDLWFVAHVTYHRQHVGQGGTQVGCKQG